MTGCCTLRSHDSQSVAAGRVRCAAMIARNVLFEVRERGFKTTLANLNRLDNAGSLLRDLAAAAACAESLAAVSVKSRCLGRRNARLVGESDMFYGDSKSDPEAEWD